MRVRIEKRCEINQKKRCEFGSQPTSLTLGDSDSPLSDCVINNKGTTNLIGKVESRKEALVY